MPIYETVAFDMDINIKKQSKHKFWTRTLKTIENEIPLIMTNKYQDMQYVISLSSWLSYEKIDADNKKN